MHQAGIIAHEQGEPGEAGRRFGKRRNRCRCRPRRRAQRGLPRFLHAFPHAKANAVPRRRGRLDCRIASSWARRLAVGCAGRILFGKCPRPRARLGALTASCRRGRAAAGRRRCQARGGARALKIPCGVAARTMERSVQTGPGPAAAAMDDAGAAEGRRFPARWMTAQSKQYSAAAGVAGFGWAGASAEPCPTVPMAGCEAGQHSVCAQWT